MILLLLGRRLWLLVIMVLVVICIFMLVFGRGGKFCRFVLIFVFRGCSGRVIKGVGWSLVLCVDWIKRFVCF